MYAGGSTGLATLRRDGFASMDAVSEPGSLTTRLLKLDGRYLFVNADARGGELTAEVLAPDGQALPGFATRNCLPVRVNSTCQRISWNGARDLARLRGRPVRLRFHAVKTRLYSFWISPHESGASHGYVAAGGPGFTDPTDTVGRKQV
jgi:hypothetical protein